MANDTTGLAFENFIQRSSTILTKVAAPWGKLIRTMPLDKNKTPGQPAKLFYVSEGPTAQTSANPDWKDGSCGITPVSIPMKAVVTTVGVDVDLNLGLTTQMLFEACARAQSVAIQEQILSVFKTANGYATAATVTAPNFGSQDFDKMFVSVPSPERAIILAPEFFAKVRPPTWFAPNFDSVYEQSTWTGGETNLVGLTAAPGCAILVYAKPEISPIGQNVIRSSSFTVPQLGIDVSASLYFLPATREMRFALSVYIGIAPADTTAATLLLSS